MIYIYPTKKNVLKKNLVIFFHVKQTPASKIDKKWIMEENRVKEGYFVKHLYVYLNYHPNTKPNVLYLNYVSNKTSVIVDLISTLEYIHYFSKKCSIKPILIVFQYQDVESEGKVFSNHHYLLSNYIKNMGKIETKTLLTTMMQKIHLEKNFYCSNP